MNKYTVLLLLPEPIADDILVNTYLAHVTGDDWEAAVHSAQRTAAAAHDAPELATEYMALLVIDGHHYDLADHRPETEDQPLDPPGYAARVRELEAEGLTTSDAQGIADMEFTNLGSKP